MASQEAPLRADEVLHLKDGERVMAAWNGGVPLEYEVAWRDGMPVALLPKSLRTTGTPVGYLQAADSVRRVVP